MFDRGEMISRKKSDALMQPVVRSPPAIGMTPPTSKRGGIAPIGNRDPVVVPGGVDEVRQVVVSGPSVSAKPRTMVASAAWDFKCA